ncbi:hypothetical protein EYF80_030086 [Liparis tanakae]|uniref:Uncharacterized protein n=1 Tax=Liparis tanakae TaxID=230148 RepID=A0A4Z2H339_9TELE|nr:hypothetical protein EYF80_030086 [Liparis tanakae]
MNRIIFQLVAVGFCFAAGRAAPQPSRRCAPAGLRSSPPGAATRGEFLKDRIVSQLVHRCMTNASPCSSGGFAQVSNSISMGQKLNERQVYLDSDALTSRDTAGCSPAELTRD